MSPARRDVPRDAGRDVVAPGGPPPWVDRLAGRWTVPLLAGLVTLLVRLPFTLGRLWDHDSVQFALGVLEFDLAAHQPHPPGYPLYIAVLKLLAALGLSPRLAMVTVSVVAAAVGAVAFSRLAARLAVPGRRGDWAGDAAGGEPGPGQITARIRRGTAPPPLATAAAVLAGALYAFNPLLWFYAELPLIYAVEGGLTAVLAWAAFGMADGPRRYYLACALFALAGGVRPSTLVLLFPLFLFGLWRAWRASDFLTWKRLLAGAGLGVACILAWLVPLAASVGGLAEYQEISGGHFDELLPVTSVLFGAGWPALAHNLEVLVKWAVQGLVPAVAMLLAAAVVALLAGSFGAAVGAGLRRVGARLGWLLAWGVPPILFFALFHVTKAGYTLIHLPALMLTAVLAAAPALVVTGPGGRRSLRAGGLLGVTLVAAVAGATLFLAGGDRGEDDPRWHAAVRHEFNRTTLTTYEADLNALVAAVDSLPRQSIFLAAVELSGSGGAGAEGFLYPYHRHLQWYVPDYPLALLVPEQGFALVTPGGRESFRRVEDTVPLPAGTRRVVFVLAATPQADLGLPLAEVVLANRTFRVLSVPVGQGMEIGAVRLAPARARPQEGPVEGTQRPGTGVRRGSG